MEDKIIIPLYGAIISGLVLLSAESELLWAQLNDWLYHTDLTRLQVDYWNHVLGFWQPALIGVFCVFLVFLIILIAAIVKDVWYND